MYKKIFALKLLPETSLKAGSLHVNIVVIHAFYSKGVRFDSRCWPIVIECKLYCIYPVQTDTPI
jgi:hypothetical protein